MSYLIINCYFPVDQRNLDIDNLIRVLQDVKFILDSCGNDIKVILTGDLNADFDRNTNFVSHVKTFLVDNNLQSLWSLFDCDFTQS